MELNSLLFPAPTIKYTAEELDGEVMYIPRHMKFRREYRRVLKKKDRQLQAREHQNAQQNLTLKDQVLNIPRSPATDRFEESKNLMNLTNNFGLKQENEARSNKENECLESENTITADKSRGGPKVNVSVLETSKLDLSEIQEENAIQAPVQNLQATDRGFPKSQGVFDPTKKLVEKREAERLKALNEQQQQQKIYQQQRQQNLKAFYQKYDKRHISHYVPAMHIPYNLGSSKMMIYFHANAEDIVLAHELLDYMRSLLRVNVVAIEYPGYGLYTEQYQKRQNQTSLNVVQHSRLQTQTDYSMNEDLGIKHNLKSFNHTTTPRFGEKDTRKQAFPRTSHTKQSYNLSLSSDDEETNVLQDKMKTLGTKSKPAINDKSIDLSSLSDSDGYEESISENPYMPIHEQFRENVFEANEENILTDALYVYDYINQVLGIEEKNIIVFGRSMGSGPATHVASLRKPGSLLLMSAFKSIRAIAQDQAGSVLKYLIQDRFKNIEKISKVSSPTFLVHGMKDSLIPFKHSKDLHDNCGGPCSLILPTRMNHNDFDFCEDLITPYYHFLKQCDMSTREPKTAFKQMNIPDHYFQIPRAYKQKSIPMSWACCCGPTHMHGNQSFIAHIEGDGEKEDDSVNYNGLMFQDHVHGEDMLNSISMENSAKGSKMHDKSDTTPPLSMSVQKYMPQVGQDNDDTPEHHRQSRMGTNKRSSIISRASNSSHVSPNVKKSLLGGSRAKNTTTNKKQTIPMEKGADVQSSSTAQWSPTKPEITGLKRDSQLFLDHQQ